MSIPQIGEHTPSPVDPQHTPIPFSAIAIKTCLDIGNTIASVGKKVIDFSQMILPHVLHILQPLTPVINLIGAIAVYCPIASVGINITELGFIARFFKILADQGQTATTLEAAEQQLNELQGRHITSMGNILWLSKKNLSSRINELQKNILEAKTDESKKSSALSDVTAFYQKLTKRATKLLLGTALLTALSIASLVIGIVVHCPLS